MDNKPLKNYKCEELLIKYDTIENVSNEYENWHRPKNIESKNGELAITMFINILVNGIAVLSAWSGMDNVFKVIVVIALISLFIYFIICVNNYWVAHKKIKSLEEPKLDVMLVSRAKEKMRYTGIARIVYIDKGKIYYLVGEDYFLPHCNLNFELGIDKQEEGIIRCLNEFGIQEKDIIRVTPVDNLVHDSIKPIRDKLQMNAYVFYDVVIKEQVKKKITKPNNIRKWITIEEMKKTTVAISTNKDVIELIEAFSTPKESFENLLGNYKIIWNITSKCSYNCDICATYDVTRKELSMHEKLKVLNNICTARDRIESVDFAGGDPLQLDECTTIIQSAIEQLGADKVSITTTGDGFSNASENEFLGVVKHCEITIDAAHANLMPIKDTKSKITRNENNYSEDNINKIHLISERAESLTINVPIINDDLDDKEIEVLLDKIIWIKKHTRGVDVDVSILRLMPVGRMREKISKETYLEYNPISVAKKIQKKLEEQSINCRLHCSLRILPSFNDASKEEYCQMFENKLGIDCAGNVFACAWAGYLVHNNNPEKNIPTKNPYYLGNLTKTPLIEIIMGESRTDASKHIYSEIDNKNIRKFCSVVSYYASKQMFKDNDPLSKFETKK